MGAIVVIVANVIGKKSFQVSLVHSDDVIEQITTAAFYPALGHSVLPRTSDRDCGGGFARDLKGIGYRRHLAGLPKRRNGVIVRDRNGDPVICGGTPQSWNKGHRD